MLIKIFREHELARFRATGYFAGSADDLRDGFIHLSTRAQTRGTLDRHFSNNDGHGEAGVTLATFDEATLGEVLRWEPSRGGELFPHFYGELSIDMAREFVPLSLADDGRHVLPEDFQ